ncbi:MAG: hypothetical protein ACREK4_24975, partial [Candidatus Rokuibacteriota bacterium]
MFRVLRINPILLAPGRSTSSGIAARAPPRRPKKSAQLRAPLPAIDVVVARHGAARPMPRSRHQRRPLLGVE